MARALALAAALAATPACGASPAVVPTVEVPLAAPASAPTERESEMARIPGGTFDARALGGDAGREVRIATFEIDRNEVTVAAYQRCVDSGACSPAFPLVDWPGIDETSRQLMSQFCIGNRGDRPDHPVNCVDHPQAEAFCAFAGKRLPTEDEWEYAARGTDGRPFPWGADPPDPELLDACDAACARGMRERGLEVQPMFPGSDGYETTAPVRSFPAGRSPFGLYDMAGNVWEWTASPCAEGEPCAEGARVERGGGWLDGDPRLVRATARKATPAAARSVVLGFRCAR